jgi:uncharacterized protein
VIEVRESSRGGRGLFAAEPIDADVLVTSAPLLLVPAEHRDALKETLVDEYVYEWDAQGTAALALGPSSMCNHDGDPNAYLWLLPDTLTAELWSLRAIAPGEEITVSYRAAGDDEPLWFEVRGADGT